MVVFPHCKINLGLHVTRKRDDGYHDIETVFFPLRGVRDVLEVVTLADSGDAGVPEEVVFTSSGLPIDGKSENNLCVRAYHLLKQDFPEIPSIRLHLHKDIPMGAGLGGGSSDGTRTLMLLNNKYNLQLTDQQLIAYAQKLGSDCPFFVLDEPCYATGRGEILESVDINLSGYYLVLVNPGIHVSTSWAFANILPATASYPLKDAVQKDVSQWRGLVQNDFEKPVFEAYPEIADIRRALYAAGAIFASMTGSGSSVFGIFFNRPDVKNLGPNYRLMVL